MGENWFLTSFPLLFGICIDLGFSGWAGPGPGLVRSVHSKVWWVPSVLCALGASWAVSATAGTYVCAYAVVAVLLATGTLWFSPRRSRVLPPPQWVHDLRARTFPVADEMHFWRLSALVLAAVVLALGGILHLGWPSPCGVS